ncbi:MAG: T9SS type A sorting domain-containing protein [Bacteroidota bacterium]
MKKSLKKHLLLRQLKCAITLLLCLFISQHSFSQNVVVTGALAGNGSYADLKDAFTAINGGVQTAANITVNIIASTTETASAVLNAGAWTTVSITPSGGIPITITGNITGALVDLNGADNVFINGINNSGNSLTISNTNTGTSAITLRFIADAAINTITNCSLLGSGTAVAVGVVVFSTASGLGNSANTISNCNIGPAGTNLPVNGILSAGSSGFDNFANSVMNCNIFDFFSSSLATAGILVNTNSTNWTITGNRIYQTALRTYGTANTHRAIQISAGNGHSILNNIIGYGSSAGTGVYAMNSTVGTRFIAINLAVGTTMLSSVQGNTVSAITLTTSSSAATANGIICGVNVTAGNVDIGGVSGNLIGGTSGTDLIAGSPTAANGMVVGFNSSSTGTINILNNYIGGISSSGIAAAISGGAAGINISGIATSLAITGNTIGNITPDNIRGGTNGLTTAASPVSGINLPSTSSNTIIISANTIRNLASYGTGNGYVRGIWTAATQSVLSTYSITANLISNLVSNSGLTTISNGQTGAAGINISNGTNDVIATNTISGIALVGTAAIGGYAAGITIGNATSPNIFKNRIYDITNASTNAITTAPGIAAGIVIRSADFQVNIHHNMISLGGGSSNNTAFVGILGNHGSSPIPSDKIYFNTINIEGVAASGAQPSFGFMRGDFTAATRTAPVDFRNNLITNTRSGGTGSHYAIGDNYGLPSSTTGWGQNASNYNVLNANPATVGWWNATQTFAGWKTAAAGDPYSFSGIAVTYVNPVSDLHLNMGLTPTYIESGAQNIAGLTSDIDGQNRPGPSGSLNGGAISSDIGADEIDAVPIFCNAASGGIITPASGTLCSGQIGIATTQGATFGLGISYQWQVGSSPGGPYVNVSGGAGANTISYTSTPLTTGVYYIVLKTTCANISLTNASNEVTLTVNTTPSVALSSTNVAICSGQSFNLSGLPGSASNYMWNGPVGFSTTAQSTIVTNASINASGNYSFTSVVNGCTSAPAVNSITVNATPTSLTLTPASVSLCAGGSQTLNVAGGNVPGGVMSFTPNTNQSTATTYPSPYSVYYGGQKMQFLILASELTAAGIIAGPLTSIQFPVIAKGTNWGVSLFSNENWQVSLGLTSLTSFGATFQTGLTVVTGSANYTPVIGYNVHNFSPTFVWDGTSNVIVETVFSNNITGGNNDGVGSYYSPTTFQSTMLYVVDGLPFSAVAAATTTNSATNLVRPDFIIKGQKPGTYTWTPASSLSSVSGATVVATPTSSTVYTVMVSTGLCSTSASRSINVTPIPTLSILASSNSVCAGNPATLTAMGASSFGWSTGAGTNSIVVSPLLNTVYTVTNQTLPCPVSSTNISISANPLPSLTVTPASVSICPLTVTGFTASGAATYSWSTGAAAANTTVNPATTSVYTVTGTDALGCSSTATSTAIVYPVPTISVTPASASVCLLSSTSFTASGGSATYSWSTGSSSAVTTVTPSANSTYTVNGISTDGCIATATVSVAILTLPVIIVSPPSPTICVGESLIFSALGASTYTWLPTNTATVSISVSPAATTAYTVTGTDANSCRNTSTFNVVVVPCTGIADNGGIQNLVTVYPNPSNGLIQAEFGFDGQKTILISNSLGAVIHESSTSGYHAEMDLSSQAKGVYFIKVITKTTTANYRVVIQ